MPSQDWKRLGAFVTSRRAERGCMTQRAFAKVTGLTDRTIGKLENGQRVGWSTLGLIEAHLGWEPGSARQILQGGDPVIRGEQAPPRSRVYSDPVEAEIWDRMAGVRVTGDRDRDDEIKRGVIRYVRAAREDEDRGRRAG